MTAINDGGPAFPRDHASDGHNGMTLRDYFAAKAMQGVLARNGGYALREHMLSAARNAYDQDDAMLAARAAK